ncbi:MAG: exopolysaccharide biosynthesis protein [Spirulinaceae cyanobacterium]
MSTLSQAIVDIFSTEKKLSLNGILQKFPEHGYGFLLAILALPSALPIPAPGYATPFGLALAALGWQMVIARERPWLPNFIGKRRIHIAQDGKFLKLALKFINFFEKFVKPRLPLLHKHTRLYGLLILLCGLCMCLPIPLTNTLPSLGIFLLALGFLETDGLFLLLGSLACFGGIVMTLSLITLGFVFGWQAVFGLKELIKGWLGL